MKREFTRLKCPRLPTNKKLRLILASAAALMGSVTAPALAAVTLVSSFEPGLSTLVGIAFDPVSKNIFIYPDFSDAILEFTPTGTQVPPDIPLSGNPSGSFDMDFALGALNIGGTTVPNNTLLIFNGNDGQTLRGENKNTGALLATKTLTTSSMVGAAYHLGRKTVFDVNFSNDTIQEINPATGATLNTFSVQPAGAPAFDVFFGDVDVNHGNGDLFIVSSSQNTIRELKPNGAFVRDIDVGALGVSGMSGITFNDGTGEAYISSTNGTVYRLSGFPRGCAGLPGTIFGTTGANTLTGTAGNDVIIALAGNDNIDGMGGNDTICPGSDNDTINGNTGTDTVVFGGTTGVVVNLATGSATGEGSDTLSNVENVTGSSKADNITGNEGNNTLNGSGGNDKLNGVGGNDKLIGSTGDDTLDGGTGTDTCDGGTGTDTAANCETVTTVP